jgi:hypothetical protein
MRKANARMDRFSRHEPGGPISAYLKAVMAHGLGVK